MGRLILAINPGSTSTKISLYEESKEVFSTTLRHTSEEIGKFGSVIDQLDFRKKIISDTLLQNNIDVKKLSIIVGRGGVIKPITSGAYEVNDAMIKDIKEHVNGEHASNLGGMLAREIALEIGHGVKAIIVDPVVVDELDPVARITGHKLVKKVSIFHALNQKAIAKKFANEKGRKYEELNLIVAHLGGGVSVGMHHHGRVIDVNDALRGEGPFSPERTGTLAGYSIVDLCFCGKYSSAQVKKMINGEGGIVSYLGTNSFVEVEKRIAAGDKEAALIADAFIYKLAKEIGAMSTVVEGKVDAILVTGGIAYGKGLMEDLKKRISFIAPVYIYPGEDEMGALASNALAVLDGKEEIKIY